MILHTAEMIIVSNDGTDNALTYKYIYIYNTHFFRITRISSPPLSRSQRVGDTMMAKWAEVMTGMQPKTYFLLPRNAWQMAVATLLEVVDQYVRGRGDKYYEHPEQQPEPTLNRGD